MEQILVIVPVSFLAGALLLLERRCIGLVAMIQPLILCLAAGMIIGDLETGLWYGISLQLLSVGQHHYCNWALAGVITAFSMVVLNLFDIHILPGDPTSIVLLCSSIIFSIMSDLLEKEVLRRTSLPFRSQPLWNYCESFDAFERLIHHNILKGFIVGGLETIMGLTVTTLLCAGIYQKFPAKEHSSSFIIYTVPLIGIAFTLASLSKRRYSTFSFIGVLIFIIFSCVVAI